MPGANFLKALSSGANKVTIVAALKVSVNSAALIALANTEKSGEAEMLAMILFDGFIDAPASLLLINLPVESDF